MNGNADKYEDEEWYYASRIVLAEEREERNSPRWVPTLLNGSCAYSVRVAKKCEELRHWEKVSKIVLEEERKERNDPEWVPRKLLNGALAHTVRVQEKIEELRKV
jgi:hypothetical protein